MKYSLLVYLLLAANLLSSGVRAQANFQDGYVVRTGKDTVRGQIDFKDWVISPARIAFLDLRSGSKTDYSPSDITAFSVNGEIYRSYRVKVYPYSRDAAIQSESNPDASPHDITVFLRLVTGGRLNLYHYREPSGVTYFFIQHAGETAGVPEQLRIGTRVVEKNGISSVATDDLYRYQLVDWVGDCPATAQRPVRVDYDEKSLRRLVFTYNNCGKDTVEQRNTAHSQGKTVRFIPLVGYFHSSVGMSGGLYAEMMNWPAYNGITGGLGMQVFLPGNRQQFSFVADVLYRHFASTSSIYEVNSFTRDQGFLDYDQLQLDILFRYLLPAGKIRPFLNAGLSNTLIINNKSQQVQSQNVNNEVQYTDYPMFGMSGDMRTFQFGIIGGAGISAGHFALEARVEWTNGISQAEGTSAPLTNVYLLAGWAF